MNALFQKFFDFCELSFDVLLARHFKLGHVGAGVGVFSGGGLRIWVNPVEALDLYHWNGMMDAMRLGKCPSWRNGFFVADGFRYYAMGFCGGCY